jgi:hypothetical protein
VTGGPKPGYACAPSWPSLRAERAAEMLTTLFETARLHGATIQVLAQPAGESSQSGQAP